MHQPLKYENLWDINTIEIRQSDLKHSVIQANGTNPQDTKKKLPLSIRSFWEFLNEKKNGEEYWGAYNSGTLTARKRRTLAKIAWLQRGCKYRFKKWPEIKTPSIWDEKTHKLIKLGSFRCDALVEYCYEQLGVDYWSKYRPNSDDAYRNSGNPNDRGFFTEKQEKECFIGHLLYPIFYPAALMARMEDYAGGKAKGTPPQIKSIILKDEEGNPIEPDEEEIYPVSGVVTIEADISDGDYGSGVDRMVVLVEDDKGDTFYLNGEEYIEGDGEEIPEESMDDHDEDVEGDYTLEWDTNNFPSGFYTLHILAYDEAGNVEETMINVHEDYNTYIPTPEDFGEYWKEWEDDSVLIPKDTPNGNVGGSWTILGFRTYIYVSEPKDIEIGIIGDDGVGLYVNGEFVCGRGDAEDPMSYGVMHLLSGWNKVEVLVYNGPTVCWLEFDKKIGNLVEIMDTEGAFEE